MNFKLNNKLFIFLLPMILNGQIENQVRDDNLGLFKNQRLYHSAPKPLFKSRAHNLDFVTDIPRDSVLSATLFFKTNSEKFKTNSAFTDPFFKTNSAKFKNKF